MKIINIAFVLHSSLSPWILRFFKNILSGLVIRFANTFKNLVYSPSITYLCYAWHPSCKHLRMLSCYYYITEYTIKWWVVINKSRLDLNLANFYINKYKTEAAIKSKSKGKHMVISQIARGQRFGNSKY